MNINKTKIRSSESSINRNNNIWISTVAKWVKNKIKNITDNPNSKNNNFLKIEKMLAEIFWLDNKRKNDLSKKNDMTLESELERLYKI